MATKEVDTPAKDDIEFDYKSVQKKFNIFLKNSQDNRYPKTKNEFEAIKAALKNQKFEGKLPKLICFSISKENENILLYKKGTHTFKVIPVEDCFDIIVEAHLTLIHGKERATYQAVCQKYFVPFKWVKHLVRVCNVCNREKYKDSVAEIDPSNVCDLYIKKIENVTDEKRQILFYVDRASQYVFLRPLRKIAEKDEIAFELLKLFANFGVPKTIVAHLKKKVFHEALKILEALSLPYVMPKIQDSAYKELSEGITKTVVPTITKWKRSTHSETWTSALWTVQFVTNTTNDTDDTGSSSTAYHRFFKVDPNIKRIEDTVTQEEKSSSANVSISDTVKLCGECSQPVYRKYSCHICRNVFHFTCCERSQYLMKEVMVNRILSTCFTCKRIPT